MKISAHEDRSRCSASRCRQEAEVGYQPGATPANPDHFIAFCWKHLEEFGRRADSCHPLRDEGKGGHDGN
jgi:hypothetical protein